MPEQGNAQATLKENTLQEQKQNPKADIPEILKKKIIYFFPYYEIHQLKDTKIRQEHTRDEKIKSTYAVLE